jgi:hypothetical protein
MIYHIGCRDVEVHVGLADDLQRVVGIVVVPDVVGKKLENIGRLEVPIFWVTQSFSKSLRKSTFELNVLNSSCFQNSPNTCQKAFE